MRKITHIFLLLFFILGFVRAENSKEHTDEIKQTEFNAGKVILEHVSDSHEIHLWGENESSFSIPLPVILFTEGNLDVFMSSNFHHGHSTVKIENREYEYNHGHIKELSGKSVLDFSITKNVAGLFIAALLMVVLFGIMAKSYTSEGIPTGISRFLEPFVLFVRDDIAITNIGEKKYIKFMPYLLTVFFLIWILNLLGLLPFGFNVSGNIAFTLVLGLITYMITTFSGNKEYWKHIFWMPGISIPMKIFMAPIEFFGTLTKPFALIIRLFANITAGHIVILSFISLIFILKNIAVAGLSVPFALFISVLELLVAFLQAFIFTMLSALFIGMAVAEHDHH